MTRSASSVVLMLMGILIGTGRAEEAARLYPFQEYMDGKGLWGYMEESGTVRITPRYHFAPFLSTEGRSEFLPPEPAPVFYDSIAHDLRPDGKSTCRLLDLRLIDRSADAEADQSAAEIPVPDLRESLDEHHRGFVLVACRKSRALWQVKPGKQIDREIPWGSARRYRHQFVLVRVDHLTPDAALAAVDSEKHALGKSPLPALGLKMPRDVAVFGAPLLVLALLTGLAIYRRQLLGNMAPSELHALGWSVTMPGRMARVAAGVTTLALPLGAVVVLFLRVRAHEQGLSFRIWAFYVVALAAIAFFAWRSYEAPVAAPADDEV